MTDIIHISTSGGLISAAFIENIREPGSRQQGIEPESFALPWSPAPTHAAAMEQTIAAAWELLLERWDAVRLDLPAMDVSQVRARWLLPLFQLLDFEPVYQRGDTVLDEGGRLRFALSHRGWAGEGAPVLHTVAPAQGLDERSTSGRGNQAHSPHDTLQAYLNASPRDRWAILSNGILLRLLRDYHHTFTKGYVQFDLESILETRSYGDFRALYRMAHASRFLPPPHPPAPSPQQGEGEEEALSPLEQFYKDSIAAGIKVGEDLRGQVRQAIEALGNGFLDGELIRRLQADGELCRAYYGEILHVIYRILFLLFAEQRGMLPGRDSLYAEVYAISALRARAEGDIPREDDFCDLWEGLKVTFRLVREGVDALGVFGYDGMLFDDDQTPLLNGIPSPSEPGRERNAPHPNPLPGGAREKSRPSPAADEGPGVRAIRNSDLLRAIRALTLIEREGFLQRISYADLGVEELGSIYESLLDYTPRVTVAAETVDGREIPPHTFFLDPRGSERKTTGSYYTHPSLVNELIKSALLPVAWDRLRGAGLPVIAGDEIGERAAGLLADYAGLSEAQRAAGEEALLSLKVCDPAAGSGHFLVAADNALGAELARVRTGDEYPAEADVQAARRDVLARCIYAVDLNPMAVELCKVSLWINASVPDRPLSFLDHHIQCGNSLIGATPELMAQGVPADAFALGITGDDPETARRFRAQNRQERRDLEEGPAYQMAFQVTVYEPDGTVRREYITIGDMAEDDPHAARERYLEYLAGDALRCKKLEADCWTAAFFWPLTPETTWAPTYGEFLRLQTEGPETLPTEALAQIEALAQRYRFFHWHLRFPDVFGEEGAGGFDVVLGNPPWERIKLQEKEFFADKDAAIAEARTTAIRQRLIDSLPRANPVLYAAYTAAIRDSEAESHFLRDSERFPLSAHGDINTYQVFAGLVRQLLAPVGRTGIVLPTGIATDYFNKEYFAAVTEANELLSLYDFENRAGLFPGVHRSHKFSLITLAGPAIEVQEAEYAFFLHTADELADPQRRFTLRIEDLRRINPNTQTCPVFRTRKEAGLTTQIYLNCPVWSNEATGEDYWGVRFLRMIDPFSNKWQLTSTQELDLKHIGNGRFGGDGEKYYVPLYEGKMMYLYDHRLASVIMTDNIARPAQPDLIDNSAKADPNHFVTPRYWIREEDVLTALDEYGWNHRWLLVQKKVTSPTNERTHLATILPLSGASESLHVILIDRQLTVQLACTLVGNLNSFVFDFVSRQKLGGTNFNYFVLQQLPVLPPDRYAPSLCAFIVPRVVELTYTAWDLQSFARDILNEVGLETWTRWFESDHLGSPSPVHTSPPPDWAPGPTPPPFVWDEARRARLRAELDALYAHLYGLTREELDYILETFPIVRRRDEARWGEYRTKRMILEKYEEVEPLIH